MGNGWKDIYMVSGREDISYLPDMSAPGAVKKGEVELIAGAVLKNSKMAGVLKGIKLLGKTS